MKNPKKVKMGKRSKAHGSAFELRTRKDLEEKGFVVSKWQNNVEFYDREWRKDYNGTPERIGKLVTAKPKMVFNPMIKRMIPQGMSSGFPDFIAYQLRFNEDVVSGYEVIGVESKLTGTLDKEEKEKCQWLLKNKIFSKILISKKNKVKNKIVVEYIDFVDIEKRMK